MVTDTLWLLWLEAEARVSFPAQLFQKGYIKHCDHDPARLQAERCEDNKTCSKFVKLGVTVHIKILP